jgi:hypothetical protein
VPSDLFSGLKNEPEGWDLNPLDDTSPEGIKVACASNLDSRLKLIRSKNSKYPRPTPITENSIGPDYHNTNEISMSMPTSSSAGPVVSALHPPQADNADIHHKHFSALLRLLYVHLCLNPGNQSPHLPSLLVPLYSTLIQECNLQDLAHVEADTFWLFEAIIGEFSELEDEEGGNLWMRRLGERLAWADADLLANLVSETAWSCTSLMSFCSSPKA